MMAINLTVYYFLMTEFASNAYQYNLPSRRYQKRISSENIRMSLEDIGFSAVQRSTVDDFQNAVILLGGVSYITWERRPKGAANDDLLSVRKSTVPKSNLGVFATKTIPAGTVIGEYPGYLINVNDTLYKKKDDKARALAQKYMWAITEDVVLDPTNKFGILDLELSYLFGMFKVPTTIARINEPPPGKDCNVATNVVGAQVIVTADRDIFSDEELFMDYGRSYDRTDYPDSTSSSASKSASQIELKNRRIEEVEEMMTVQPVVVDELNAANLRGLDQDTTRPDDGFLAKLSKKDDAQLRAKGVLSPEDAAEMFRTVGSSMFGNAKDQELLQELIGRTKGPDATETKAVPRSSVAADPWAADKPVEDDSFMASFMTQLGVSSKKSETATTVSPNQAPPIPQPISPPLPIAPVLSKDEADDLQRRLDDLTDEELERVFAKLRATIGSEVGADLSEATAEYRKSKGGGGQFIKMPRAPVVDNDVREKYKSELDAIESELENIYRDPIATWQEIVNNPDKFLESLEDIVDEKIDGSNLKEEKSK